MLTQLCAVRPMNGLMEKRQGALVDTDKAALSERIERYFDPKIEWGDLEALGTGLTRDAARFKAKAARKKVLKAEVFDPDRLLPYIVRPFDSQWCYYSAVRPLWNEPRPSLWVQCWKGNSFFVSRFKAAKDPEGPPFYFVGGLSDDHMLSPDASCFPVHLRHSAANIKKNHPFQADLIAENQDSKTTANLTAPVRSYLADLRVGDPDSDTDTAGLIWMHALAIGYSPSYLTENADGIRQDWPRIPLPDSKDLLLASAALGRRIASLLDTETDVGAVHEPPLQDLAVPTRVGGGQLDDTKDFAVTAGWGHGGKGGITMPGKGRIIERDFRPEEREVFLVGPSGARPEGEHRSPLLGDRTCDVYLNDVAYWKNVPIRVWEYTIGGYQVMKKWLSYREAKLLGRALTKDEVRYVQEMARRIAAILLLEPDLDANYASAKAHAYLWPG
jgi:hypothetical protein